MSITSTSFPQPKAYCVIKQCACEYANMFGCCVYTFCIKHIDEKTEYLTHTILRGDKE